MLYAIKKAVQRFVGGLSVILAISMILFIANETLGDPVYALLPMDATGAERDLMREQLGLNDPIWSRLVTYVELTVKGEFGNSYKLEQPVMEILPPYLWGTAKLILLALPLGLLGGVFLGLMSLFLSNKLSRILDKLLFIVHSLPGFVPIIIAIEIFAVQLKWVPSSGSLGYKSLILPVTLLAGGEAVKIGILLRSKIQDVLEEKFIITARAKGISFVRFYGKHVLFPALSLIFSFASIQVGVLLSSAVVLETILSYPGIGSLTIQALANRDFPLLQACVVIASLFFVCSRFLLDLLYPFLDPRVRQNQSWEKSS